MELLRQIGVAFTVVDHQVLEEPLPAEAPQAFVQRLALEKARSAEATGQAHSLPVLGADTIVVYAGQIMGKPRDREDALRMWRLLSGVEHQVHSAVALCLGPRAEVRMSTTVVRFRPLSAEDCDRYWDSGEPLGKAGAYAIQGLGALFVQSIAGSYTGVVGLPLFETAELLALFGVRTGLSVVHGDAV
jgi:septum formation protein